MIKYFKSSLKLVLLYLFFMFVYANMLLLFNVSLIYEAHNEFNFIACIISTIIFSYLFFKFRIENIGIYIFNFLIIIETIIVILGYDYVISNFYQSTYDGKLPRKLVEISYTLLNPFSSIISIPVAYNCTILVLLLIPMYFIMLSFLKVKKNNRN